MRRRILLIEDHPDLRETIGELLEINGYEVLLAKDGLEGLFMAISELPVIILSDLCMPGLDGYELVSRLQNDERTCRIPVILTSADLDLLNAHRNTNPGIIAHLAKPFDEEKLLTCLNNAL